MNKLEVKEESTNPETDAMVANAAIGAEDPRWQKLRDLLGLDGWHEGLWSGIPNPDQIVNHVEHIANERARLLKAHIDGQPEAAIGAGGQLYGIYGEYGKLRKQIDEFTS